jgi:peptide/nickel transport system substrate-binding protein
MPVTASRIRAFASTRSDLPCPDAQKLLSRLKPPVFFGGDFGHLLGTDQLGRDILTRCLYGLRLSLGLALAGSALGLAAGALLGVVSGLTGGLTDDLIMGLTGHPDVDENSDYEAFGLKPVGTGPYKVREFIPGERLVWERFEGYWGPKAPFRTVTLKKITELSSRITALKNGEVDIITNVPPDQLAAIQSDSKLKVEEMVTPLFHVVIFNTQHPKMADERLRQGLAMALDRDTLNKTLWLGKAVVPASHTYPQYGQLYMPEIKTFEYDTAKAKELIKASGYDGFPIRYDTSATYYTNGLLAAQAIQEMWAGVGVKLTVNVVEQWTGPDPTMMSRNWSNPMYFPDPVGSFGTMWHPTAAAVHEGRFKPSKEYAAVWNRFRYSMDIGERKKA